MELVTRICIVLLVTRITTGITTDITTGATTTDSSKYGFPLLVVSELIGPSLFVSAGIWSI